MRDACQLVGMANLDADWFCSPDAQKRAAWSGLIPMLLVKPTRRPMQVSPWVLPILSLHNVCIRLGLCSNLAFIIHINISVHHLNCLLMLNSIELTEWLLWVYAGYRCPQENCQIIVNTWGKLQKHVAKHPGKSSPPVISRHTAQAENSGGVAEIDTMTVSQVLITVSHFWANFSLPWQGC